MNTTAITQSQMSHRTFISTGKKAGLKALSAAAALIALIGVCVTPQAAVAQQLQIDCYTFDALAGSDPFKIGHSIPTQHGTVNIRDFLINGTPASPANTASQRAEVQATVRAGSDAPELYTNLVNVQVVPDTPLAGVSMRYYRVGGTNGNGDKFANLAVNGELHDIQGDMADYDNMILGDPNLGRVLVRVHPEETGITQTGLLELFPLTGSIHRFAFGGVPLIVDDVCMVQQ